MALKTGDMALYQVCTELLRESAPIGRTPGSARFIRVGSELVGKVQEGD